MSSWSRTQDIQATSSGEAELAAMVKASTELIGVLQLLSDWGLTYAGHVFVDSGAALGVVGRRGYGKLRHVRVGNLWVQEKRETGELVYDEMPKRGELLGRNLYKNRK